MEYIDIFLKLLGLLLQAIGLIKAVDTALPQTRQRFSISRILFPSAQLTRRLGEKYPDTKFFIANQQDAFYEIIARELVRIIGEHLSALETSTSPGKQQVRVGLVCGPMVYKTGEWIKRNRRFITKKDFSNLMFVAMNRAAESDNFKYSANYLVTFFSEIFPKSTSRAYTSNAYDEAGIEENRTNADILLCSAGPLTGNSSAHSEPSYISGWFNKLTQSEFPQECIGDFCLVPINSKGQTVQIREGLLESMDPYPQFENLNDIKSATVLFPVNTNRSFSSNEKKACLTGKELIAKTVLQSNIVDLCVLSTQLGDNLDKSIGNYVIQAVSQERPYSNSNRACFAFRLEDVTDPLNYEKTKHDHTLHTIIVYDPKDRLDSLDCATESKPSLHPEEIPQIIFSEIVDEDHGYDWKQESGEFKYTVNHHDYTFRVDQGVRRPGQWGLVTAQWTRYYIDAFARSNKSDDLSVWDLGCGCGMIGILAATNSSHSIGRVLFSDISQGAVDCAGHNLRQYPGIAAELKAGDLFEVCETTQEKFSVITFNPPFLPMEHIEKASTRMAGVTRGRMWLNGSAVRQTSTCCQGDGRSWPFPITLMTGISAMNSNGSSAQPTSR